MSRTAKLPKLSLAKTVSTLQNLQRQRSIVLKSRNMQANRLQAVIAGVLGYSADMKESERKKKFIEASAFIKQIQNDEIEHEYGAIVKTTMLGIDSFNVLLGGLEKSLRQCAKMLPVAAWAEEEDQKGFGLLSLGKVIGETGDLNNYGSPTKVWKRMGMMPWTFDDKTQAGSTWKRGKKKRGSLPDTEWTSFGYSPRRKSIMFLIGEGLVKQNGNGPYRTRYDEAKAIMRQNHLDEKLYPDMRCHLHGISMAGKLLLKNLWKQWTGK